VVQVQFEMVDLVLVYSEAWVRWELAEAVQQVSRG